MTALPTWLDRDAFPFPTRTVDVGDGKLSVVDTGAVAGALPIVMSHGTPMWSFEWRHIIRAFNGAHRCIAPDHLGFGLSERPRDVSYMPDAQAVRFSRMMDALDLGKDEKVVLVVHDFGGPFAFQWAMDHADRVAGIVVFNTFMWPVDKSDPMHRVAWFAGTWLMGALYRWANFEHHVVVPMAYGDRKKLTPEIKRQYMAPFPDAESRDLVLFALARALLESSPYYARLWEQRERLAKVPMSFVWGTKDPAFNMSALQRFRDAYPHADATEVVGAGHWAHEEQPEVCIDAMKRFLARL